MKRLIYYPGFESTNENWLKFALLYIGKLSPILPTRADEKSSELYKKLTNETDLLLNHRPGFHEGYKSALDAIDIVDRICATPQRFDMFFNNLNVVKNWKDKSSHDYFLYHEKFSNEWAQYCVTNGFASYDDNGIRLTESLAVLYMTVLANRIADDKEISPITDYEKLDKLSFFLKKTAPVSTNQTVNAKGVISLKLPANINQLKIEDIIKLRNSKGFKKNQEAFHEELSNFLTNLEAGDHSKDFIKKYSETTGNFTEQIMSIGTDSIGVGIGTWLLLDAIAPGMAEVIKLATTTVGIVIKQGFSISKTWKNSTSKRNCRRYLATLENIPRK
ncbi:hypothetical protein [Pedobacter sp. Hv1]|uniref:hypothetical protein n=1 Tax=Pedobacter sp. Hv1 TaxID=1740090 RepID=UPI0006D8B326|nr:hypothetical protein [Pedobacter sp. Hv1]KQB99205.1 hypothetical protein AQF98_16635 [Pedobacter sp. Hv1]